MSKYYTFVDIETTGLDYRADQIIEIAALKTDGERLLSVFHTLVKLGEFYELTPEISELTGIKQEDLANGMDESETTERFMRFAGDSIIVAHNAPFDLSFIYGMLPYFDDSVRPEFICTRAMSFLENPFKSASLAESCKRHKIPVVGHHRALTDALMTFELFKILREKLDAKGIDYQNVVIDSEERPLNYIPVGAKVINAEKFRAKLEEKEEQWIAEKFGNILSDPNKKYFTKPDGMTHKEFMEKLMREAKRS